VYEVVCKSLRYPAKIKRECDELFKFVSHTQFSYNDFKFRDNYATEAKVFTSQV